MNIFMSKISYHINCQQVMAELPVYEMPLLGNYPFTFGEPNHSSPIKLASPWMMDARLVFYHFHVIFN